MSMQTMEHLHRRIDAYDQNHAHHGGNIHRELRTIIADLLLHYEVAIHQRDCAGKACAHFVKTFDNYYDVDIDETGRPHPNLPSEIAEAATKSRIVANLLKE